MTTIILDDIIYWLQRNGGASRYWYEITSRLDKANFNLCFVRRLDQTENPWFRYVDSKFVFLSKLWHVLIDRYIDCALPEILKESGNIVYHSSHYRLPKDKSLANVVTVHDFTYEAYKTGLPKLLHVWQKKRAIKNSDVIICISEYTKKQLLYFYPEFNRKCIRVVYHGVGSEFHYNNEDRGVDSKEIIFLGSRDKYKRFDIAIEAVQHAPEKILVIVGGALAKSEEALLNLKIPQRWRYAGRLTDAQLNLLYSSSFCFLYPSDSEGFGLPLLEAMKAGCPVICANSSVFPEVAADAALYAREQTAEAYVEQINKLNSRHLRKLMISRGILRSEIFTWDACFNKTIEAYELALQIRHKVGGL